MDTKKLHPIDNQAQLISAIEKGSPFGGEIWQTNRNERKVLQIYKIFTDIKFDKFVLMTFDPADLDPERPIFVRLCYRNLLFRLEPGQFHVRSDKLMCEWPKEAMALEMRPHDRYVLPFNAEISLTLKRTERNMRETVLDLEVRIVDVSEKGLGILVSGANRDFLRKNDHFWIKAIDHRPLDHFIFGTVSYVAPKGYYLKRGDVRVGLCLESTITFDIFEYLKKKSHMVLTA